MYANLSALESLQSSHGHTTSTSPMAVFNAVVTASDYQSAADVIDRDKLVKLINRLREQEKNLQEVDRPLEKLIEDLLTVYRNWVFWNKNRNR